MRIVIICFALMFSFQANGQNDSTFGCPIVEVAEFPGGIDAFYAYIKTNLKDPIPDDSIAGKVRARFIIDSTGQCTRVDIIQSLGLAYDNEVKRILLSMPKWTPQKFQGKTETSRFTIPINFYAKRVAKK